MHWYCCTACIDIRTESNADEYGKFITSRIHNFVTFSYVMPWSTSTRIKAQPELSTRQQQHRQSSRCAASVSSLQDSKTDRTYKYNRTATAQQYRYSSIEQQFSSISTVYSSTIHPRANSPTLNPYSTLRVKSNLMSAIGISASETKASYRLLCLTLKRQFF